MTDITSKNSPIKGKKIIFLGSSVTYGSANNGESFVECLEQLDEIETVAKEAVSGTTLVDKDDESYVKRMINNINKNAVADLFLCQLSTNDASLRLPLGEIATTKDISDFDTSTITGAIEYIIAYALKTWGCKVAFYTGSKYEDDNYDAMVHRLLELQTKWDIGVIDMWTDKEFNDISDELRNKYMDDVIHPLKAGYLEWWTPYIEKYLYEYLQ